MKIILSVDGMKCQGCEKRIITALSNNKNIKVQANYQNNTVIIESKKTIALEPIKNIIEELGFIIKDIENE